MRVWPLFLMLSLAACGDSGMTRNFGVSRDAAPETMAATRVPLSTPPELAMRPTRPIAIGGNAPTAQPPTDQAPTSAGEEALVEAAGPAPDPNVRTEINRNAGLVYPSPEFVDRLMNWTPPPGYTPIITQGGKGGGWFSRLF
ncbi:MAG TPA: DUF3035 domain-containing protein [Acetobacteraceae bacterium]|jgi:hypothetical protein